MLFFISKIDKHNIRGLSVSGTMQTRDIGTIYMTVIYTAGETTCVIYNIVCIYMILCTSIYRYYNTCVSTLTTQTRRRCDAACTSDVFHLGKQDVYT